RYHVPRLLETLCLAILVAVVALRPLVAEAYEWPDGSPTAALAGVADPSPARTLLFDFMVLVATCGWLISRAIGTGRRYRRTGLEWGAVLVALAVVVSCVFAGNKRVAIDASIDWLCYPLLAIVLVQLLGDRWRRVLLLSVVLACGCAQAAQCFEQYFVGFDETWRHYESVKETMWAAKGIALDSPRVQTFERRLQAREAFGFLPHGNVAGSHLVLCALSAAGLAAAAWRRRRLATGDSAAWLVGATGAVVLAAAAMLTGSVGALVSCGLALTAWLVVYWKRRRMEPRRRAAVTAAWGLFALAAFGVVGLGLVRGRLPGWSLTFRWQYWSASMPMIADHALTGVGRENFGRHYLRYKAITSPEEVANPHNLFVQAATDWGLLGLGGVAVMAVGASLAAAGGLAARRSRSRERKSEHNRARPAALDTSRADRGSSSDADAVSSQRPRWLGWGLFLLLVVVFGRMPLLGSDDPDFLYYATTITALASLGGFAGFLWCATRRPLTVGDGANRRIDSYGIALGPFSGVAAGLVAFFIHDMINFAMFVPATATTFFALLAVCIAERSDITRHDAPGSTDQARDVSPKRSPWRRWWPAGVCVVVTALAGLLRLAPAVESQRLLDGAASAGTPVPGPTARIERVDRYFRAAAEADSLDPHPWVERARWWIKAGRAWADPAPAIERAAESVAAAIERDPYRVNLRRLRRQLYGWRAEVTGREEDYD
ncbi:MAG: O-antigen ligase family protein, partial [Phycisphaerae bacterium]